MFTKFFSKLLTPEEIQRSEPVDINKNADERIKDFTKEATMIYNCISPLDENDSIEIIALRLEGAYVSGQTKAVANMTDNIMVVTGE